jgi:aquaporin Z
MTDPEPRSDAEKARELRSVAAESLQEAARQSDPREFDRLTRHALGLIERARAIQHGRRRAASRGDTVEAQTKGLRISRKLTVEFIGTLWLVLGGCGSAVLAAKFPEIGIGLVGVALAFGFTVLTGAYALGHISGAHFNPAVTVGLTVAGRFRRKELPGYIIAQVLGGTAGTLILYLIASGAPQFSVTAGFAANGYGAHSPGGYSFLACVASEVTMTFFFLLIILGATSFRAPRGFAPLAIGIGLTLIHLVSIPITNTGVNPARSTGPALFVGDWALSQLWLFWVAPIVGAAAAGFLYAWLGAEDNMADRDDADWRAALEPGEPLAPATAREPR